MGMNEAVKAKWVAALRSGKYDQVTGGLQQLSRFGGEVSRSYCCLGVLCDLAVRDGVPVEVREGNGSVSYDGDSSSLPESVRDWAGLGGLDNPDVQYMGADTSLITLNDGGTIYRRGEAFGQGGFLEVKPLPFEDIADVIEEQL